MAKPAGRSEVVDSLEVPAVARIAGLSVHMVNYLCRHGIVEPSAGDRRGRGVRRKYSYADMLLLRVVAKLLNQGTSVLRLKKSLTELQARGRTTQDLVTKKFVATDGHNLYFEDGGILELLDSGQMAFAFVLELGSIRDEVLEKIEQRANA